MFILVCHWRQAEIETIIDLQLYDMIVFEGIQKYSI